MGSRVVMLEKRKSVTRNNVLHIWPFVIEDLKSLGVKVFFPKFCTGSMNHISKTQVSFCTVDPLYCTVVQYKLCIRNMKKNLPFRGIRRLQSVLVKVALILGIEVHVGLSFTGLIEPRDRDGPSWRVTTQPVCPALSALDIDVLVGAEGKHVTVPGN